MRSPTDFIAKPMRGRRYDNTKDIGGIEFIVSTSEEDHTFSNRYAEVVATPLGYSGPIVPGDTLLVHHNVFKHYYDMKGRRRSGKSFFRDDQFLIDTEQFFLYKHDDNWNAVGRFCFVKPVPVEDSFIKKVGNEEPLMAEIVYPSEYLIQQGVKIGDKVIYEPDSEYEFTVDDEKLFRMYEHQIKVVL
jgi:hypothetical protein